MEGKLTKDIIKERIGGPATEHAPGWCLMRLLLFEWKQICPKNAVCSRSDTDVSWLEVCVRSASHCTQAVICNFNSQQTDVSMLLMHRIINSLNKKQFGNFSAWRLCISNVYISEYFRTAGFVCVEGTEWKFQFCLFSLFFLANEPKRRLETKKRPRVNGRVMSVSSIRTSPTTGSAPVWSWRPSTSWSRGSSASPPSRASSTGCYGYTLTAGRTSTTSGWTASRPTCTRWAGVSWPATSCSLRLLTQVSPTWSVVSVVTRTGKLVCFFCLFQAPETCSQQHPDRGRSLSSTKDKRKVRRRLFKSLSNKRAAVQPSGRCVLNCCLVINNAPPPCSVLTLEAFFSHTHRDQHLHRYILLTMSVTGNTEQLQPQTQTIIDQQKQNVCWCDLKKRKRWNRPKNSFHFSRDRKRRNGERAEQEELHEHVIVVLSL